jgi:hypothetical protein
MAASKPGRWHADVRQLVREIEDWTNRLRAGLLAATA